MHVITFLQCFMFLIYPLFFSKRQNRYVQSYHIKTVFLWYCEQTSQSEFTEASFVLRVFDLLKCLQRCLMARDCPHYFIPTNNLFQYINEQVIEKTLQNVNVSIEKAHDIWINNRGLFLLPCTRLTRVSISIEMTNLFLASMKRLFAAIMDTFTQDDDVASINANTTCNESETIPDIANIDDDETSENDKDENSEDIDIIDSDGADEDSADEDNAGDDYDGSDNDDNNDSSIKRSKKVFWREVVTGVLEAITKQGFEDGEDMTTVMEIIYEVTVNNQILNETIFRYLCTRITPRNIVRFERHSGLIETYAELLSYIGSYGDILQALMDRKKRDYND